MAKSEGAEVREAYDGPTVDHDQLIGQILDRAKEQHARSSDASESAALVSEFLEDTGINSKAYQWASAIVKTLDKKDGQHKAMDIIRSLKAVLPMVENHVGGQGTVEMDLGEPEEDEQPDDGESDVGIPISETKDADPELAADAEEFEAEAEALDDDSNVVTPIDFGGKAAAE